MKRGNINKIFQEAFNSDDLPKEDWNTPNQDVWDSISAELDEDNSKPITPWMIVSGILFLLVLILGGKIYSDNQKLNRLSTQIEACAENQNMSNLNYSNTTLDTESNELSKTQLTNLQSNNQKTQFTSTINTSKYQQHQKSFIPQNHPMQDAVSNNYFVKSKINDESLSTKIQTRNKGFEISSDVAKSQFNLPLLFASLPHLKSIISNPELNPNFNIIKPKNHQHHSTFIYASAGFITGGLRNIGKLNESLNELIDQEYLRSGYAFDFGFKKQLTPNLYFTTSIGASKMQYITAYDVTLPYDITSESTNENGDGQIDFEHSLPTSFGNIDTEVSLVRPRNSTNTETGVLLDYDVSSNFTFVNAFLGLEYQFDFLSGLYAGASVSPSYLIDHTSNVYQSLSHHQTIHTTDNHASSDYEELQKWLWGGSINLGYNLPITSKGFLGLEGRYNYYFTPHYTSTGYESHIENYGLRLIYTRAL